MKQKVQWQAWGIFEQGALVLFDVRCPFYWKRFMAKKSALELGLPKAQIHKVSINLVFPAR